MNTTGLGQADEDSSQIINLSICTFWGIISLLHCILPGLFYTLCPPACIMSGPLSSLINETDITCLIFFLAMGEAVACHAMTNPSFTPHKDHLEWVLAKCFRVITKLDLLLIIFVIFRAIIYPVVEGTNLSDSAMIDMFSTFGLIFFFSMTVTVFGLSFYMPVPMQFGEAKEFENTYLLQRPNLRTGIFIACALLSVYYVYFIYKSNMYGKWLALFILIGTAASANKAGTAQWGFKVLCGIFLFFTVLFAIANSL